MVSRFGKSGRDTFHTRDRYTFTMEIPGYKVERCIGHGGMASAYLARQTSLDRRVVLKVLDTSVVDSASAIERFLNEGRIVASLHHPHIITTYDIGRSGSDVYISMEYVDGGDLKQRLQQGAIAPVEALSIVVKIGSALAAAHEQGIVHRDVKPGNILFRTDGTPLLSDFGIAKKLTGDADLTTTGMFVGSPNYMAPEQSDEGPVDGRVDIYALGVILFEMLSGHRPYPSESVIDVILKHKKAPVPLLPKAMRMYQPLLDRMMAKNRDARFPDVPSVLAFIERLDIDEDGRAGFAIGLSGIGWGLRRRAAEWFDFPSRRSLLLSGAVICAIAYGALLWVEQRIENRDMPRLMTIEPALETLPAVSATGSPVEISDRVEREKILGALAWLGNHSLNEYRLTAPPQDNAYYYFARLEQMDPGSSAARQGMADIASRYALLAEREIAEGDHDRARSFISVGLQVDPRNDTLRVLNELAVPKEHGLRAIVARLFH